MLEIIWKEKFEEWTKRQKIISPKWFGERPGKKTDDIEKPKLDGEDGAGLTIGEEELEEEDEEEMDTDENE